MQCIGCDRGGSSVTSSDHPFSPGHVHTGYYYPPIIVDVRLENVLFLKTLFNRDTIHLVKIRNHLNLFASHHNYCGCIGKKTQN